VLPDSVRVEVGTIRGLEEASFDTILYVDVLEHIEDDRGELERAAARLRPGGRLVVLAPAHQWLFSPFDSAIGHFRRYTKRSLRELAPPGLELTRLRYLDSVGLLASGANRFLLKSSSPNLGQIRFWDRVLVRASRMVDPLLAYSVGKSVLSVWSFEAGT
jgi:SAM-dependent methyltransferase